LNDNNMDNDHTDIFQDQISELPNSPVKPEKQRYAADVINIERRVQNHTVFHVDDSSFGSSLPRPTHWSIAWSDLMMTMFILFLSMFVYQTANQEFLEKKEPEILGGATTEALSSMDESGAAFPFVPIHPGLPLMTAGTIKKVESFPPDTPPPDAVMLAQEPAEPTPEPTREMIVVNPPLVKTEAPSPPPEDILEPLPFGARQSEPQTQNESQEIFSMGKDVLKSNNLDKFATIDIIPDTTMRIILTSDLLFALGKSNLSEDAKKSLGKIAEVIRSTPYMINVVGHTDNIPMHSRQFRSNWELSVARATTVTRFFIDEMGMNPNQFVVSGYSSYRPLRPNTNAENRAKNRRVEIIISKRLPNPHSLTATNLK